MTRTASPGRFSSMAETSASRSARSVSPKSDNTCSPEISVPPPEKNAIIWSNSDWASRIPPSAARAIASTAASETATFSASAIKRSRSAINRVGIGSRSKR